MSRYDFVTASKAREVALSGGGGTDLVLNEIDTLRAAIRTSYTSGYLEINPAEDASEIAGTKAYMGTQELFYEAWTDPYAKRETGVSTYTESEIIKARAQMSEVVNYFTRLGYEVSRVRDGINNAFYWQIKW